MAKVAVVGVGAIGSVLAMFLDKAGHDVVLCTRKPLSSLSVETAEGTAPVKAVNVFDPETAPAVDWVLVATKAYDAAGAAKWFGRLCSNGAPVAIFQNGVEHIERFKPYLPVEKILPVVVDCPAERLSPTLTRQRGPMYIKAPESDLGRSMTALFQGTSAEAIAVPDFTTAMWWKLCYNVAGIVPAILLQPAGVLRGESMGELAREITREAIAVGRAEGAVLPDAVLEEVLNLYRNLPPDSMNSMHADRVYKRPMEVDARNGVIVRLGQKHGIPTPYNRMAFLLLEEMAKHD